MRRAKSAITLTLLGIAWVSLASAGQGSPGAPTFRVLFKTGATLDVLSYRMEEGQMVLHLPGGGTIALEPGRVSRVEKVAPLVHEAPPAPAPVPEQHVVQPEAEPAPVVPGETDIEILIREAAARHGLEADLLAAVIAVESGYRVDAVSPKGAQGLMQLMPGTARELNVTNAFDPAQNIDAGARHLRRLIDQSGGSYWRALAAYNAGEGKVARYGGLPPYRETMNYVKRVLQRYGAPLPPPASPGRR